MLGKTQIRKWAVGYLKDFLKPYGFKILPIVGIHGIVLREKIVTKYMTFSQDSSDYFAIGSLTIRYIQVEEIMYKMTGLGIYEAENSSLRYWWNDEKAQRDLDGIIKSEKDIINIVENFKRYFVDFYLPTFEKYSRPENVLQLWDSLETMKDKAICFPDVHNYSKMIIFSKMANDVNYKRRINETRTFFKAEIAKGEDWISVKLDVFDKVVKYLNENKI